MKREFLKGGEDMWYILEAEVVGRIDALDVKAMYIQFLQKKYTIYPRKSLTKNIGFDGSGIYCGISSRFEVELEEGKSDFKMIKNIRIDPRIIKANYNFRKISWRTKASRFVKQYLKVLKW